ncbi:hypothetical protein A7W90_13245 [Clostridium sp. Bc-iso-3]|nr:hypothetical protein A7W90_13245 [Clostridium sp. Bc-iso-3]
MARFEYGAPSIESSLNDFKQVAFIVSQLLAEDNMKILFAFETDISIEIDDSALSKFDTDKDSFNKILNAEIIPIIEAILSNSENDMIQILLRQLDLNDSESKKKEKDSLEKTMKQKVEYIKEVLINEEIRHRYNIKSTTKLPKIKNIQWEINNKIFDNLKKELNSKYATINIKVSKELETSAFPFRFLPFMQPEYKIEEISFDCDKYDIEEIIKILEEIKEKLL